MHGLFYDYLSKLTPEELFVLLVVCVSISAGIGIVVIIWELVKKRRKKDE